MRTAVLTRKRRKTVRFDAVTFGRFVREWRKENGFRTQAAFAEFAHLERTQVSRIELGEYRLHADLIAYLCDIIGVHPCTFWK